MVTIKQVAARARVSIGTVSNVMAGLGSVAPELRDRVQRAVLELDYQPNHVARSLKTRQTRMLGMVITDIANPFFPELVRGAEEAAFDRGYLLTTFNTDNRPERERQVVSILRERRADGLLVVPSQTSGGNEHLADALRAGVPVVCLDRVPANLTVDAVTVDNAGGVRAGVRHLVSGGHVGIGYLGGQRHLTIGRDRLRGYKEALQEAGLPLRPELVREGDFRIESGHLLGRELLQRPDRPTALFAANILMAVGVLRAAEELRVAIPGDVALATFDHLPLMEAFRPRLTSVVQPSYQIGQKAACLLMDRMENRLASTRPVRLTLPTELRVAESTASLRMGAA